MLNNCIHLNIGSTNGNIASLYIISDDLVVIQNLLNISSRRSSLHHIGGTSVYNQIQLLKAGSNISSTNLTSGNILTLGISALLYSVDGAGFIVSANLKQTISGDNNIL